MLYLELSRKPRLLRTFTRWEEGRLEVGGGGRERKREKGGLLESGGREGREGERRLGIIHEPGGWTNDGKSGLARSRRRTSTEKTGGKTRVRSASRSLGKGAY